MENDEPRSSEPLGGMGGKNASGIMEKDIPWRSLLLQETSLRLSSSALLRQSLALRRLGPAGRRAGG